jgi:hypothetical protein
LEASKAQNSESKTADAIQIESKISEKTDELEKAYFKTVSGEEEGE